MMSASFSGGSFCVSILSRNEGLRCSRNNWGRIGFSTDPVKTYPARLANEVKSRIYCSSCPGLCFKVERSTLALSFVLLTSNVVFRSSTNCFQVKPESNTPSGFVWVSVKCSAQLAALPVII
jgi:hypothetical protein